MIFQQLSNLDVAIRNLPVGQLARSCFDTLKRFIVRFSDPAVAQSVGLFRISLPFSHPLPANLAIFPLYDRQLPELARILYRKYPDLCAIDVGANIGDTAALIRSGADISVLCVEGNPVILPFLTRNLEVVGRTEVAATFLGELDGMNAFEIRDTPGSASIHANPDGSEQVKISTMESVLKKHPNFANAKLLKIDTDGFDHRVLHSSAEFLKTARPVVMFELDPRLLELQSDALDRGIELLKELGYSRLMFYDNAGNFLASIQANQSDVTADFLSYHTADLTRSYWDILAFHSDDEDVHDDFRKSERLRCVEKRSERLARWNR